MTIAATSLATQIAQASTTAPEPSEPLLPFRDPNGGQEWLPTSTKRYWTIDPHTGERTLLPMLPAGNGNTNTRITDFEIKLHRDWPPLTGVKNLANQAPIDDYARMLESVRGARGAAPGGCFASQFGALDNLQTAVRVLQHAA